MKWYLTIVFILLYSQVSFCHFEELKENTFLHLKKIPSTFTSNEIGVLDAVVCPGAIRQCPSLHSCCSVPGSDEVHCCPAGYSCENGVCQETRKDDVAALFRSTRAKIVKCNNQYACPDRYTCCQDGSKYHCCPMSEAVCCPDQLHCCPQGYSCSKDGKTCSSGSDTVASLSSTSPKSLKKPLERLLEQIKGQYSSKKTLLLKQSTVKMGKIAASKSRDHDKIPVMKKKLLIKDSNLNDVLCPDGESECPDGNTCCKLHTRDWGCCPFPKAVCCDDGIHCCPGNTKCNIEKKTCDRKTDIETLLTKIQVWKGETGKSNIICPDGQSECPEGNTCCKLQSGQYGCCPLPKAVCCSDGEHCCPNGYTCDVSAGTCTQGSSSLPMVKKMSSSKRESIASNIVCPDGQSECPEGSTCCKLSSGEYGCCPLPKAVCCSDGVHCCPNGYTCDVSAGTCTQGSSSLPILKKMLALKQESAVSNIVCPDGQSQCPDGNTCCKLSSGEYGCCPLPKAVCCSDGVHCCPNGYTCDVRAGKCTQGSSSLPVVKKMVALKQESAASNKVCPDGQSECPDGNTCCKLTSGEYGCCPLPNAVCCSDGVHCCPNGYTCDVSAGTCTQGSSSLPILKKMLALKQESAASNKVCPDGQSECPDGNTCCKLSSGEYGCCPLPNAVCCSDGVHCCPNGYTCDVSAGTCTQGSSSLPILKKMLALKQGGTASNKVCPDGQSECPDGNTCCKLSSGEYGCCPLPNAVCCSDGVHCCPNGYTCDVSAGTCTQGSSSLPLVKKILALKQESATSNIVCPDGQSECPEGSTCCKLSSGEYGCCPLPKAVCCSDGVHCCPNGYTCDVSAGKCTQGSSSLPVVKKMVALKQESAASNKVCPDGQSECPDGNTCCKLTSGEYGCCPLPNAVCCSDGVHCCPNGYTCDVSAGTCTQGSSSLPILKKMLALKQGGTASNKVCPDGQSECPDGNTCCKLSSGEYGCCPLPNAVCCSDGVHCCPNGYTCDVSAGTCTQGSSSLPLVKKILALKQESATSNIVCPDGQSECPEGSTCCKLSSGEYGCCPLPKAVCCSDGVHCCPNGYTCDVSAGTCTQGSSSLPMVKKMSSSKRESIASNIVCPDGQSECPEGSTCCKLSSGEYGCCPLPKAVCCSDGVHCCPNGYTCDVSAGTCTQGDSSLPMVKKMLASKQGGTASNKVCPDGQSECPDGSTCCKLSSGGYGCCPFPNAVCCSDGEHCCPNGYTCDVSAGTCTHGSSSIPMVKKTPASKHGDTASNKVCPDGQSECPDGSTCCKLSSGGYGCCPFPNAVCCSDGEHCCPNGYTCDVSAGTCTHGSSSIPMVKKTPASKHGDTASNKVCPDGQSECPDGSTCCKLSSGGYGCCPFPNAVCCSDGEHCCPNGYTCDVSAGTCTHGSSSIPMVKKTPASKHGDTASNKVCPDGQSECPDGSTCCKLSSGGYGCCPFPNAVCCSDGEHCCPNGYTCDVSAGTCTHGSSSIPMVKKTPASKHGDTASDKVCPDGQSECPDGSTCCKLSSGGYGCCPFPNAVCCSDGEHCCPNGYTCDVSAGTCTHGSSSIPMVKKTPASKQGGTASNKVCPDGQSECPDGSTCCKLSSGGYGCCPFPNAVCCSDGEHCCPNGYTCDVSAGTCTHGSSSIASLKMYAAVQVITHIRAGSGIVCPDKQYQCPNGSTCCKVPSGTYGCCPLKNAVCCSDNIHCCPEGYTCDVKGGKCDKSAERIKMMHNVPSSRSIMEARQNYIKCPDGCSCLDYETCCELADGSYGCCPLPHAVCCEDHKHCCPSGYRCDLAAGMCVTGNVRLPMLKKIRSPRKQKTPRVNLDEKVRFVPSHVQDEYPVAKDLLQ